MAGSLPVSAVVPAHNEADGIATTVRALVEGAGVSEVVVADDGSWDTTAARARRAGAQVVRCVRRRGKGSALVLGIRATRGDILLLADADLRESAAELGVLVEAVRHAEADMAVALPVGRGRLGRAEDGRGGVGLVRAVAAAGVRWLGGAGRQALLSGQRALRREWAPGLLSGPPCGFGVEVRAAVRAGRMGLRVVEVPVRLTHRGSGRNLAGWVHRGLQLVDVVRTLWWEAGMEGRGLQGEACQRDGHRGGYPS